MIKRLDKIQYRRNFEISLIITLALIIIIFYVYPKPKLDDELPLYYGEMIITTVDIPLTNQLPSAPMPPKPLVPIIFVEMDDPDILPDIEIDDNTLDAPVGDNKNNGLQVDPNGVLLSSSLPFKPREIYLHVPDLDDCDGEIKLSLRIGKDGAVKEHKILRNTLDSEECLKRIIESMYKWKYMPIIIEGDRFEFWTEKTITF